MLKIIISLAIAFLAVFLVPREVHPQEVEVKKDIKLYSIEKVLERWGGGQWTYFNELIYRESKWNSEAKNPKSTAYGLGQFLNSTWKTVGCEKTSDPYKQIDCTLDYVEARYKTPQGAIKFWNKNHWY